MHDGQTVVKYALHPRVELDFYTNTLILAGAEPRSHAGLQPGLKVSLLAETAWLPAHDLSLHLTVPTFDLAQTWDFEAWWYLSKSFGPLSLNLNFMLALNDVLGEQALQGMATLTVSSELVERLSLFGELFGTWGQTQALPPGAGLFAGVSVAATDQVSIDVGAELALHEGRSPAVTVFAGVTWIPQGEEKPAVSELLASVDGL